MELRLILLLKKLSLSLLLSLRLVNLVVSVHVTSERVVTQVVHLGLRRLNQS